MNTLICLVAFLAVASGKSFLSVISPYTAPLVTPYHYQVVYTSPYAYQQNAVPLTPTLKTAEEVATPIVQTHPVAPATLFQTAQFQAAPLIHKYHSQSQDGAYSFGYNDGLSSRSESADRFGNIQGVFNYVNPKGEVHTRQYVAGKNGFRVAATDLPVAPIFNIPNIPEETAEVKAARSQFEKVFQEAKARTARTKRSAETDPLAAAAFRVPAATSPLNLNFNKVQVPTTYAFANHVPYFYHPGVYQLSPRANAISHAVPVTYSAFNPQPLVYSVFPGQHVFTSNPSTTTTIVHHPDGFSQKTEFDV